MLRDKHHRIFGNLPISERTALERSAGPTFAWQAISTRYTDKSELLDSPGAITSYEDMLLLGYTKVNSRIKLPVEEDIRASYLLLEKKSLLGLTTVQIADYAAMSSLIETSNDSRSKSHQSSILSLFNDRKEKPAPPDSVSEWDLILLHSLYSSSGDVRARLQRSEIQQRFVKEVAAVQTQGK